MAAEGYHHSICFLFSFLGIGEILHPRYGGNRANQKKLPAQKQLVPMKSLGWVTRMSGSCMSHPGYSSYIHEVVDRLFV